MNKKNVGSATVELSILLPLCLFLTVLIIQTAVFFYNRETVTRLVCEAAIHAVQMEHESGSRVKSETEKKLQEGMQDRLVFSPKLSCEVKVSPLTVEVRAQMTQAVVAGGFLRFFGWNRLFSYQVSRRELRLNPARQVWLRGQLKDAGKASSQKAESLGDTEE